MSIKDYPHYIREECNEIEEEIRPKKAKIYGDPV